MFKWIKPSFVNLVCSVLALILAIMKIKNGQWFTTAICVFAALFFFGTYARLKKIEEKEDREKGEKKQKKQKK
jgi:hypothetical protein